MDNIKNSGATGRIDAGLLQFLAPGASLASAGDGQITLLAGAQRRNVAPAHLAALASAGLIIRAGRQVHLSPSGKEVLDGIGQRPERAIELRDGVGGSQAVVVNRAESPLAQLMARKTAAGAPFLTREEFDAGERLRADFTRGMLSPRTSANWTAAVSGGRRGDSNAIENITETALSARRRVEAALSALGGDLSGAVADICCFLKGFEQVEMERGWPKRSAKFLLRAGLAMLAQHYWPRAAARRKSHHWGTEDYRPKIGG